MAHADGVISTDVAGDVARTSTKKSLRLSKKKQLTLIRETEELQKKEKEEQQKTESDKKEKEEGIKFCVCSVIMALVIALFL